MPSLGDICSGNCLTEIIIPNDMFNLESIVYLSTHPTESSGPDGYHPMFSERLEKVLSCCCINLLRNPWKKVKYQLPGNFKMHLLQKLEIKVLHNNVSQLVSVICRMLEHIIKNHLLHYSNQNNFLHLDNMDFVLLTCMLPILFRLWSAGLVYWNRVTKWMLLTLTYNGF